MTNKEKYLKLKDDFESLSIHNRDEFMDTHIEMKKLAGTGYLPALIYSSFIEVSQGGDIYEADGFLDEAMKILESRPENTNQIYTEELASGGYLPAIVYAAWMHISYYDNLGYSVYLLGHATRIMNKRIEEGKE